MSFFGKSSKTPRTPQPPRQGKHSFSAASTQHDTYEQQRLALEQREFSSYPWYGDNREPSPAHSRLDYHSPTSEAKRISEQQRRVTQGLKLLQEQAQRELPANQVSSPPTSNHDSDMSLSAEQVAAQQEAALQQQQQQQQQDAALQQQLPGAQNQQANRVDAVQTAQVRMPPFWREHATNWFTQAEAIFLAQGIRSENTKYCLVLSALDATTFNEIADLIGALPAETKYTALKPLIIARFTDSTERRLQKLLTELELGDSKPSQLLRRMKQLADGRATDDIIRVRWLALLPPSVQKLLKIFRNPNLEEVAQLADQLMEGPQTLSVDATEHRPRSRATEDPGNYMQRELDELKMMMATLATTVSRALSQPRGRSQSRDRGRSNSRGRSPSGNREYCYYHEKFGNDARKCRRPCSFPRSVQQNLN